MAGLPQREPSIAALPRRSRRRELALDQDHGEAYGDLAQEAALVPGRAPRRWRLKRSCPIPIRSASRSSGDPSPTGPFYSDFNGGEPNWLLTKPRRFEALIAEQLLVRWLPEMQPPSYVPSYVRPPDLGEIDFANFPSGDDPF